MSEQAITAAGGGPSSWWRRLTTGAKARRIRRAAAMELYRTIVAQAREPFLYAGLGAPDTREGRLELVALHAILAIRRLRTEGAAGRDLAQELFDTHFADVDRLLREWGVGDLSVGRHVKRVAQSFYARAAALEPGLRDGDARALAPALARNVFDAGDGAAKDGSGGGQGEVANNWAEAKGEALARYLLAQAAVLADQPTGPLLAGQVRFAPAEAAAAT